MQRGMLGGLRLFHQQLIIEKTKFFYLHEFRRQAGQRRRPHEIIKIRIPAPDEEIPVITTGFSVRGVLHTTGAGIRQNAVGSFTHPGDPLRREDIPHHTHPVFFVFPDGAGVNEFKINFHEITSIRGWCLNQHGLKKVTTKEITRAGLALNYIIAG